MGRTIELIADGTSLDVGALDQLPIKLSFLLQDFDNIDKRSGSYSNYFDIPATKRNNVFFKHYYNAGNFDAPASFVASKSAKAYSDGVKIFDGFLKGRYARKKGGSPINYSVGLIGSNLTWANTLSTLKLKDVVSVVCPSFTWDATNVKASFLGTKPYICPLVNYRDIVQTGTEANARLWWEMRPWLWVEDIVVEMFKQAGYDIVINFFSTGGYQNVVCYFDDDGSFPRTAPGGSSATVDYSTGLISDDRTCLDFLRGLVHNFDLYFSTHEGLKTVEMDTFKNFFNGGYYLAKKIDLDLLKDISKDLKISNVDLDRYWSLSHIFDDTGFEEDKRFTCLVDFGDQYEGKTNESKNPFFAGCTMNGHGGAPPYYLQPNVLSDDPLQLSAESEPRLAIWGGQMDSQATSPDGFLFESDPDTPYYPYVYTYHSVDVPFPNSSNDTNINYADKRQLLSPYVYPFSQIIPGTVTNFYLDQIATLQRGQVFEGSFALKNTFIADLDFRRSYYLEGVEVFLNEIKKFNPLSAGTTEAQLQKLIRGDASDLSKLNHYL